MRTALAITILAACNNSVGAPAAHGVLVESPTATSPCGLTLVTAFVMDSTAALDTSCTADVAPLMFDTSTAAMDFLGTTDLWGD